MELLNLFFFLFVLQCQFDIFCCLDACLFIQNMLDNSDQGKITENSKCLQNEICNRTYSITKIKIPPFSEENLAEGRLEACCKCVNYEVVDEFANITELTEETIKNTDFIFPVPGTANKETLFGMKYIPLFAVDEFFFITRRQTTVYLSMMKKMKKVYPIILICILMTILSGFITWILETWFNKEEFPRPFLIGWFEGCWWSFISMTTVGYGDKTPRSIPGRLFAVAWILTGITLFGILTGLITSAIQEAEKTATPSISNAKVGVLKYRTIDMTFLAKSGGKISLRNDKNIDSFDMDIMTLIGSLKAGDVEGIILDKYTYSYLVQMLVEMWKKDDFKVFGKQSEFARGNIEYLLTETSFISKLYPGESMTYGALVRDKEVFNYFKDAIIDNRPILESYIALKTIAAEDPPNPIALFEITSPYFTNVVIFLSVAMGGVLMLGVGIEMIRLRRSTCKRNLHHQA